MASSNILNLDSHNAVAVLSFPSGKEYPRLSRAALTEIRQLLDSLRNEKIFRGVVIAANERAFATGADIEEIVGLDGVAAREFAAIGQEIFTLIHQFPMPVVAAIRGYCLGGGLDLALTCHARVAAFDASFGHPGASLGLLTGWGGTQRLTRLIGKAQALQMLLTGDRIPASQALTVGLVDELVAPRDLIHSACRLAERMGIPRNNSMPRVL